MADVGHRHEEHQTFFAYRGMSRHKRQLGAVLGIGIGLAALYDIEDLRGQLQSWQNSLVQIIDCVTNDTVWLTCNFNRLRVVAVLQVSSLVGKLFRGLKEMMARRLFFI